MVRAVNKKSEDGEVGQSLRVLPVIDRSYSKRNCPKIPASAGFGPDSRVTGEEATKPGATGGAPGTNPGAGGTVPAIFAPRQSSQ